MLIIYLLIFHIISSFNYNKILDPLEPLEVIPCSIYNDCFNCTVNPHCRWAQNSTCIKYTNIQYSFPVMDKNNISLIGSHLTFLQRSCYEKLPNGYYLPRENREKILSYCGNLEYIFDNKNMVEDQKEISMPKVDGQYGIKNLFCVYKVICTEELFANIEVEDSEDFYFVQQTGGGKDELIIFNKLSEEQKVFTFNIKTFIFYSKKPLDNLPFRISGSKNSFDRQVFGWIALSLMIIGTIFIFVSVYCIRKKAKQNKAKCDAEEVRPIKQGETQVKLVTTQNKKNSISNINNEENLQTNLNDGFNPSIHPLNTDKFRLRRPKLQPIIIPKMPDLSNVVIHEAIKGKETFDNNNLAPLSDKHNSLPHDFYSYNINKENDITNVYTRKISPGYNYKVSPATNLPFGNSPGNNSVAAFVQHQETSCNKLNLFEFFCCICNKPIDKYNAYCTAKCGHFYHQTCLENKLEEIAKENSENIIKCTICQTIIYKK